MAPGDDPRRDAVEERAERGRRNYGSSAGYGSGGSTRDYHEVLGEDADGPKGPNPLDKVIPPKR